MIAVKSSGEYTRPALLRVFLLYIYTREIKNFVAWRKRERERERERERLCVCTRHYYSTRVRMYVIISDNVFCRRERG